MIALEATTFLWYYRRKHFVPYYKIQFLHYLFFKCNGTFANALFLYFCTFDCRPNYLLRGLASFENTKLMRNTFSKIWPKTYLSKNIKIKKNTFFLQHCQSWELNIMSGLFCQWTLSYVEGNENVQKMFKKLTSFNIYCKVSQHRYRLIHLIPKCLFVRYVILPVVTFCSSTTRFYISWRDQFVRPSRSQIP